MKNIIAIALLAASAAFGQVALTQTTLAAAVTQTANRMVVASATGISAGTVLYIQDYYAAAGELVTVQSVTGTTLVVVRGNTGRVVAHTSGARVLIAPAPRAFYTNNPLGACTATAQPYTPYVNTVTGEQWICSSVTGSWVPGWNGTTPSGVTAAVASAAGLITPSGPLFHITGTAAITGFTLPIGYVGRDVCVIPDGAFTTTTANNIAIASTGVVGRELCWSYDVNTAKFYPSY